MLHFGHEAIMILGLSVRSLQLALYTKNKRAAAVRYGPKLCNHSQASTIAPQHAAISQYLGGC